MKDVPNRPTMAASQPGADALDTRRVADVTADGRIRRRGGIAGTVAAAGLALAIAFGNLFAWEKANPQVEAPAFDEPIGGLAYNAYGRHDSPLTQTMPPLESIERDMALLSGKTHRIRTYTSSEFPTIPALAEEHQLLVTAGVWLDSRTDNVEREIHALEQAVRSHSTIERVIVGNETILHAMFTVDEVIEKVREVRRRVRKPVSTAEPWHVWLRYPELVRSVDFITVHLLPYWEGLPVKAALDYSFERLEQIRKRYPGKKILIGEIGWPSQGDRRFASYATPAYQAQFIREFLVKAKKMQLDYFLMEAIDQPWKIDNEGRAGPYWGIMKADRSSKFELSGPIETDPSWRTKASIASAVGALLVFAFLVRFRQLRLASRVAFGVALQAVVGLCVWMVAIPFDYYLEPVDWIFIVLLVPALAVMATIFLTHAFEFSELFWKGNLKRHFGSRPLPEGAAEPLVSVHLACCNEQPDMVIATIRSLENLDYRNFEVIVVDNNTKDPALWRPVEDYMKGLDARFKFFHLPSWPGFKAGALNFALSQTDPAAEIVGVVDADYRVVSRWLKDLVGHFADPQTAVVQAPQAHRGWKAHVFRQMMNFEYDGFFRIGMHHRNERDAIIQHGTMTLVRAQALRAHGNWSEWCICEDAELGLRLMKAGLRTVYVDQVMGRGLTPDTFNAFKKQRRRWAEGAMQIMKGHARALFRSGELTAGQRYHFIGGWMSWIGDALHLLFALAAMAWTIAIIGAPQYFSLPILLFMVPLIIFFFAKTLMGPLLYLRRVRCSMIDVAGSALAGMALSHGIARGIWDGLLQSKAVFEVTVKGTSKAKAKAAAAAWGGVREEGLLLIGLLTCVAATAAWRQPNHVESAMWMAILVMQAIPYAAALICAGLSRLPDRRLKPMARPSASPALAAGSANGAGLDIATHGAGLAPTLSANLPAGLSSNLASPMASGLSGPGLGQGMAQGLGAGPGMGHGMSATLNPGLSASLPSTMHPGLSSGLGSSLSPNLSSVRIDS